MHLRSAHPTPAEIVALIDGELGAAPRGRLEAHLAACPPCAATRTEMHAIAARVCDGVRAEAGTAPGDGRLRLQGALRREVRTPDASRLRTLGAALSVSSWLPAAATAVLAVAVWQMGAAWRSDRQAHRAGVAAIATALPLAAETPGSMSVHSAAELCAGARPSRFVTDETRRQVLRRYGMEQVSANDYELDALITPELGGTTEAANLWPQRYGSPVWNARVKDDLERLLPALVCRGDVDLATAQRAIATDWIAAYKRYFHSDTPLASDAAAVDDDELILLPASWSPPIQTAGR